MSPSESQYYDKKSLRCITGRTADWAEIAKDCVAFANAKGGRLAIGIEDLEEQPPAAQRVEAAMVDRVRKRLRELTVNVEAHPELVTAPNGGMFMDVLLPRATSVASTSDGRYFIRIGDESRPVLGEEILRLANERASIPWETLAAQGVPRERVDASKLAAFMSQIQASGRVKESVKEKTADELLDHYQLAAGPALTNLGVLCLGQRNDRARLGTAPVVQAIKYDDRGAKVNKWVWDDFDLSPMELVDRIWLDVPEFRETYELPDGLQRSQVSMFDEEVIRELLVNALVHRPYTQRGDIFLNFHPDRLEVVNPGLLPLGVTPSNILHQTVRRNEYLARVFHDLNFMEREGSGFDKIFEVLLAHGRSLPLLVEGPDSVHVTIQRRIIKPELIGLMAKANESFKLTQRERICLGILALGDGLTAVGLAAQLELPGVDALKSWLGRLLEVGLVKAQGRTKGTRYYVPPEVLGQLRFEASTTLARIEPHRLRELLLEDLRRYPGSAIGASHARIGREIPLSQVKRKLEQMEAEGAIRHEGDFRWRRYWAVE